MQRLKALSDHFKLEPNSTLFRTTLPSGWEYDRSKSKLNLSDAKAMYYMYRPAEENKIT